MWTLWSHSSRAENVSRASCAVIISQHCCFCFTLTHCRILEIISDYLPSFTKAQFSLAWSECSVHQFKQRLNKRPSSSRSSALVQLILPLAVSQQRPGSDEWRFRWQLALVYGPISPLLSPSLARRCSCILMLPRWDWRCHDRRWRRRGVKYQGHWQVAINHTCYQPTT